MFTAFIERFRKVTAVTLVVTIIFSFVSPAFAATAFGSVSTAQNGAPGGSTGTLTITKPSSTTSGDFLIAAITFNGGTGTSFTTVPTGWTLVRRTDSTTQVGMATYYKVAGGSEPASYAWAINNGSSTPRMSGGIIRYTGINTSTPVDVHGDNDGNNDTPIAPSVTTTQTNDRVITFFGVDNDETFSTPASTTERYDITNSDNSGPGSAADDFIQASIGSTGTKTSDNSGSSNDQWVAQTIALKEAVVDVTAPVISQVTPVSTPTTDNTPNYTFTTDEAGTITYGGDCSSATTSAAIGSNTVTFNTLTDGTHSNCTITVTDASSNVSNILAVNTFTVDTTGPVITLTGSTPVTVEVGSVYTDAGATAADNLDGDRTANIITVNSVNANVVGSYPVTYDVVDTVGNAATQVTRTVNVVDTTIPVISLVGSATVSVNFGATYTDAGATAADNYDGNITASIVTVNPVNTGTLGNYIVTYNVTDAHGNAAAQVTRSVDVVDVTSPVITITGANPMTIEVGGTYTELGAVADDDVDPDFAAIPSGTVNTSAVGTYTITYNATDSSTNAAVAVTRTVNVVDTTIPVLTLLGITPTDAEWWQVYTDAGATASDNLDGDITASIITVNPVNTLVIGIYTVTYNVSDAHGNDAVEITRTVNVVDTTDPILTTETPVPTPTNDNTPSYTFTTTEAGTITYGGSCSSITTSATSGSNTIVFNTLADGTYTNCTITVTDVSSNVSNILNVNEFTVDTTIPPQAPPGGNGNPGGGGSTPTPEPTPTPTPVPTPEPTPENTPTPTDTTTENGGTHENFFPPVETPTPVPTPSPNPAPTPTTPTWTTGGGTTGGTTTTGETFNPADANLDSGGGVTPETATVEETTPTDATLDIGGWVVVEERSYTLLWILLGILALLNGWWFFAAKNKKEEEHRRAH